jgi:hypothetical protein
VASVAAANVEADRPFAAFVEDHVDDAAQLDSAHDDPLVQEVDVIHLPDFCAQARLSRNPS